MKYYNLGFAEMSADDPVQVRRYSHLRLLLLQLCCCCYCRVSSQSFQISTP